MLLQLKQMTTMAMELAQHNKVLEDQNEALANQLKVIPLQVPHDMTHISTYTRTYIHAYKYLLSLAMC